MAQGEQPPTPASDRRWRGELTASARGPGSGRRALALKLTALALALAAIVAGLLTYLNWPTKPYVLSIPVREYKHALYPVNAFAEQDTKDLAECFPNSKLTNAAFNSQIKERIEGELNNLSDHADRPVVVHLTCLATVRHGEVFLLPADALPDQPATWLPLTAVLDRVAACPAPVKLLLLDIAHPVVDPRLGVLCDYLCEEVVKLLDQRDFKSMYVLCSCGAGQVSLVSEELRTSVFAHYVVQGLRGAADGCLDGTRDKRITVKELAAFVSDRTDRWAQQNRGQRQIPRLWGQGADFTLVDIEEEPAPPQPPKVEYPEWLRAGWSKRDEMLKANVQRFAPHVLRELEEDLLRREQRWRGGFEPDTLAAEMRTLLAKDQFKQLPLPVTAELPPRSLALELALLPAAAQNTITPQDWRDISVILEQANKATKKEEFAKLKEQWLKITSQAKGVPALLWADALINSMAGQAQPLPQPSQLAFVQEAIQQLDLGPKNLDMVWFRHIETAWLQRVTDSQNKRPGFGTWPALELRQSLRALRAREPLLALIAKEPGRLPESDSWLDKDFRKTETNRRQGEKLLLWDRPPQWPAALKLLQQAERDYRQMQDGVKRWQSAAAALEDALALLPGYVPYLAAAPRPELEEKMWLLACDQARQLGDFLAVTPAAEVVLPVDGDVVAYQLQKLQSQLLDMHAGPLTIRIAFGDPADVRAIEALLASPRLDAVRRENLWNGARELKLALLKRTWQFDQQDLKAPPKALTPLASPPAEDNWPAQVAQARLSTRLTLGLLQLSGVQRLEPSLKEWQKVQYKTEPRAYDDLADMLSQVWLKQLPEQFNSAKAAPARAERLGHIMLLSELTQPGQGKVHFSVLLRQQQRRDFRLWLAARYDEEADFLHATGSQESPEVIDFFRQAARDFRR